MAQVDLDTLPAAGARSLHGLSSAASTVPRNWADTQREAVPRLNELARASPQQQHFSKHIFSVQQHARPWPGNLSRVRWRQPFQLPPGMGWAGTLGPSRPRPY